MRIYLLTIQLLPRLLLGVSILIMLILPLVIVFKAGGLSDSTINNLYNISHITILLVMIVRPLADIFTKTRWIRPLVILRKGVGVLSASIVVSFIFSKIIIDHSAYINSLTTAKYWSFQNLAIFAHLADISAILLLVTSNSFSKRILGRLWKIIQKLSYVYFYASSLYIFIVLSNNMALVSMFLVTILTMIAYSKNRTKAINEAQIV
jgi:DMSO/TMAO reductase YedYZ heme-binding membrane subunit